jgi:glycosyltransferase involved in cell wall biosynthesis
VGIIAGGARSVAQTRNCHSMRVLQLIGTVDPSYGGPVTAALSLNKALRIDGHDSWVVALDGRTDVAEVSEAVLSIGPSRFNYRYVQGALRKIEQRLGRFDTVLVHGIWQYQSLLARRMKASFGTSYHVFVHGALDPWFAEAYPRKQPKKAAYWRLFEADNLRDAEHVIFTCDAERELARNAFSPYELRETVVEQGVEDPCVDVERCRAAFLVAFPDLVSKRVLLFLGRLHRKKGLDLLVEGFIRAADRMPDVHLCIAGPDQDSLRPELEQRLNAAGLGGRSHWLGMLHGDVKWGAYAAAELFCLPSHSENFGIAVVESLAFGTPVLISRKVNIFRRIAESGAGVVIDDSIDGAHEGLVRWLSLTADARTSMRLAARACFASHFEIAAMTRSLVALIRPGSARI